MERRDEGRQLRTVHTRDESSGIASTARKESGTMSLASSASSCQHAYSCEEPRKELRSELNLEISGMSYLQAVRPSAAWWRDDGRHGRLPLGARG
jgi:hypothetical protein